MSEVRYISNSIRIQVQMLIRPSRVNTSHQMKGPKDGSATLVQ